MSLYGGIELVGRPDPYNVQKLDLMAMPMLQKMMRYGCGVDIPYFHQLSSDFNAKMDDLRKDISSFIPPDRLEEFCDASEELEEDSFNPDSGDQLSKLMFDILNIGDGKKLKTTKGGDRLSTGKKQLEMLKQDHPIIPVILSYREYSKLDNTYAKKIPHIAKIHSKGDCHICGLNHKYETIRCHTRYLPTRATTGRIQSKDVNLSNIPTRTKLGGLIRLGFIASPGTVMVQRDWSQIELRLLAHVTQDENLIRIYKNNLDLHTDTACRAFNLPIDKIDKMLHRAPCKNVNFSVVYSITAEGLYDLMLLTYATAKQPIPEWLTLEWCAEFIELWFGLYDKVRPWMKSQERCAYRYNFVWTLFGRVRLIPEVRSVHRRIQAAGIRQGGNHKIQGTCSDLMRLAMAAIDDRLDIIRNDYGLWAWPLLTIYDELIMEADEDEADTVLAIMGEEMDNVMTDRQTGKCLSRVPIQSDGIQMTRWKKGD